MGWEYRLILNILRTAKADYIQALRKRKRKQINELEEFFLSDYGQALSMDNGEEIIEKCQKLAGDIRGTTLSYKGEVKTVAEWSKIKGISVETIRSRLRRGWSAERTLNTPPTPKKGVGKNEVSNRSNGNATKNN